ncbi:DUF3465 domain-containing protein [Acinetobacter tandoii]|uniref:DUF3465 domain-containing protein n=2 Tax=Acinetobacter tandoii TaxID=202954 RepID=A0A5N4WHR9_9GAMM|nr:DUF3465 domain-containing protein [Acinetobacter tandoii]ELN4659018.1 DUF3465 domain-containing protein [Escherichia coli]KAB1857987.1 DUF3465 domain-containing protein [Acinetobacter tandoii]
MMNKTNFRIVVVILVLIAAYLGINQQQQTPPKNESPIATSPESVSTVDDHQKIQQAFQQQQNNVQVRASGVVKAILADDHEGSRHQKFILLLKDGLTVLVAHNIDLAPRIENLQKGDTVEFYGEYEYNSKGGVIHWTHHDPQRQHIDGWLKYQGRMYQ